MLLILLVATLVRLPTLRQPLAEAHAFRQTQTAYTARLFHDQGVDLIHPQLPVLGEPWEVPFEFPLFQALASIPMSFGMSADSAMRTTGLITFLVTALLVWGLVRYVTRRPVPALAALVAFSFSPLGLLWGRTSMIEYLATAGAVAFALASIRWLDRGRWWWAAAAICGGVVGMLIKPPTVVFWVFPVLGWAMERSGRGESAGGFLQRTKETLTFRLMGVLGPPFVAAIIWTRHADAIKAASPTTEWLTEGALRSWNYGTVSQRFAAENWFVVLNRIDDFLLGPIIWLPLLFLGLLGRHHRWFWGGIVLTAILPVAVFFNLFLVHDYYLVAISPSIAMLIGAGVGWIHARIHGRYGSTLTAGATVLLACAWLFSTLFPSFSYWRAAYASIDRSTLAAEVPDVTAPNDRVIVVGLDWSPHLLYYANRRGLMLTPHLDRSNVIAEARRRGYEYFVALDPAVDPVHLTNAWPWVGVVGEHVYRLGENLADAMPAAVLGTSETEEFQTAASSGESLVGRELGLNCGVPHYLPRGAEGTWIQVRAEANDRVRIWIDYGLAPVANVDVIAVPTRDATIPLTLMCSGVDSVDVQAMFSASVPGADA